ncbi:hypothetical protein AJ80_07223 [Polytolypa hystricis UAMH7299]|uniref:Hepatocellular carcinoma-associated antigen 59-domain-containing protein n=1 Tax=Polytolypa hystricis (strain UAMH7299) TaxID=1447883 RepID=A0A2B7XRJ0_POLH7|nr:hypothetical protein AJ80_07223 [Polytolypa hystricis UAMH7299]
MELDEPLFRRAKRRKFLRKRPAEDGDEESQTHVPAPHPSTTTEATSEPPVRDVLSPLPVTEDDSAAQDSQISNILALRKAHSARKGGIGFSTTTKSAAGGDRASPQGDLEAIEDPLDERLQAISNRFVAHSGQKVDVDKHMMAYVESEMAKRHRRDRPAETSVSDKTLVGEAGHQSSESKLPQRQPASLGKLHEIDLGPDSKLKNIARTEAATRRLAGDEDIVAEEDTTKKGPPGKNGKPWRGRKRRNSDDIRRDQLVEEVLRESKLDVYDEPDEEQADDDQAADDRIAEKFRRDFLDAIQSRRRGARARNANKTTKTEAPRGPKLGGSRSARAAMRERQQEKAASQK